MSTHIVKVQVPLFTNADQGTEEALVYNEDRSIEVVVPLAMVSDQFNPGECKKFFYAEHDEETGLLHINDPAPWQSW